MTQRIGALMTGVRRLICACCAGGAVVLTVPGASVRASEAEVVSNQPASHGETNRAGVREARVVAPGLWSGRAELRATLVLPPSFDAQKPCPVVLLLPPGAQDEAMVDAALEMFEAEASRRGWAIYAPRASGRPLAEAGAADFDRWLLDLGERVRVESGVVHVVGVSNGGVAAFPVALAHADNAASLLVLPGYCPEADQANLARLARVPVMMLAGKDDEAWLKRSESTAAALREAGVNVQLIPVPKEGHVIRDLPHAKMWEFLEKSRESAAKRAAGSVPAPADALAARSAASRTIDALHEAAGRADERAYFDLYQPDAVFMGTDPSERWTMEQFRGYAHPAFAKGKGWTYHPVSRNLFVGPSGDAVWFDEELEHAMYGRCRGTGVVVRAGSGSPGAGVQWRVAQYSLSVPIPNDQLKPSIELWKGAAKK